MGVVETSLDHPPQRIKRKLLETSFGECYIERRRRIPRQIDKCLLDECDEEDVRLAAPLVLYAMDWAIPEEWYILNRLFYGHILMVEFRPYLVGAFGKCEAGSCLQARGGTGEQPIRFPYRIKLCAHNPFGSEDVREARLPDRYYHITCVEQLVEKVYGIEIWNYAKQGQVIRDPSQGFDLPFHQPLNDWFRFHGQVRYFRGYQAWYELVHDGDEEALEGPDDHTGPLARPKMPLSSASRMCDMLERSTPGLVVPPVPGPRFVR